MRTPLAASHEWDLLFSAEVSLVPSLRLLVPAPDQRMTGWPPAGSGFIETNRVQVLFYIKLQCSSKHYSVHNISKGRVEKGSYNITFVHTHYRKECEGLYVYMHKVAHLLDCVLFLVSPKELRTKLLQVTSLFPQLLLQLKMNMGTADRYIHHRNEWHKYASQKTDMPLL